MACLKTNLRMFFFFVFLEKCGCIEKKERTAPFFAMDKINNNDNNNRYLNRVTPSVAGLVSLSIYKKLLFAAVRRIAANLRFHGSPEI